MTAAGRPSSALLTSGALRNGIHGVTARSICPISPDRLRSKVEFAADEHVLSKAGLDYTLFRRGDDRMSGAGFLHNLSAGELGPRRLRLGG